jgi:hypothetical protein
MICRFLGNRQVRAEVDRFAAGWQTRGLTTAWIYWWKGSSGIGGERVSGFFASLRMTARTDKDKDKDNDNDKATAVARAVAKAVAKAVATT